MESITDVANLLQSKNIYFRPSGQDYLVSCLNPEHDDKNPSMRIDKHSGIFNCLSCGFKGNIFKYYGILTNRTSLRILKLKEKLKALQLSTAGLDLSDYSPIPFTNTFRGISVNTLKKFGAFYTTTFQDLEDRIVFPIYDISGKINVLIARHTLSDGNPRYLIYPRNVQVSTFPQRIEGSTSIVLVEGIFDMLNLYDKGLTNVVCCFGTNTLQKAAKEKLQVYKIQGISKVYIMFDGDNAGREAAAKLKPTIEELEFDVEIIHLEDNTDPGMLSQEYVDSIREYINGKNSNN